MQRLVAAVIAAGVLSLATACDERQASHFGDLKVAGTVQAVWRSKPGPPASGPARIVRNVFMLSPRRGFLITAANPGVGFQRHGSGRIQDTRDGGLTWRTVWSQGETELAEISFTDRLHGIVAGFREIGGTLKPLFLRTSDGGQHWHGMRPKLPWTAKEEWPYFRFQFPMPAVGYAVGDPDNGLGITSERWLVRTTDGGRTWQRLRAPRGAYATGMDWVDRLHGYVTDSHLLYTTSDGGESWRPVVGTLTAGYQLSAVDFLDAQTGILVGGNPYYLETPPGLVVRRTDDGGATWRTMFADSRRGPARANPFVRLELVDRRHAWAATGGCKNGQNSPCGGEIWTTGDGGLRWRRTGQSAVYLASAGSKSAFAVDAGCDCGVLWRTSNSGRSWSPLFGPRGVGPSQLSLAGRRVLLDTDAGWFVSEDAGATWQRSRRFDLDPDRSPPGFVAREWYDRLQLSRVNGRRWQTIKTPVDIPRTWTFVDEKHVFIASEETKGGPGATYASSDGGASWRRLDAPFLPITISATTGLVSLTEGRLDPPRVAFSEDDGQSWRVLRLPNQHACYTTVGGGGTAWLWCEGDLERSTKTAFFRSTDRGRSWTRVQVGNMWLRDVAQQNDELWAIASPRGQSTSSLWRSRDGGRTWDEVWPALPVGR